MDKYNIQVKLKSKRGTDNLTVRHNVSAAEIAVLRHIHGAEAVRNIALVVQEKEDRTSHEEELERLSIRYDRNRPDGQGLSVRKLLNCPEGQKPQLPVNIEKLAGIEEFIATDELFYAGEAEKAEAKKARLAKQEAKAKESASKSAAKGAKGA